MTKSNYSYEGSFALLTDLYQFTMAYGYWKSGVHEREAVFHMFYRKNPFQGGFAIACGLQTVIDFLERFSIDHSDIAYLATLKGNDGQSLFEKDSLAYFKSLKFLCDVDAVPEGTGVFPHEPLIRLKGP